MSLGELLLNPQLANLLGQVQQHQQQHHHGHELSPPPALKPRQLEEEHRRAGDDQSRVIMKFDEKRQLLQAICDRKDQLFGPVAAKMKPAQKQALWEEVIETFRQGCPDSTAELSSGYVRGIFWQNLRKRTLAKKERATTDENVKFDELDELVAQILGDKMNNTPPASVSAADPPSQVAYPNISDILLPVLQDTFSQYQQHQPPQSQPQPPSRDDPSEREPLSPAPQLNNTSLDYSRFNPFQTSPDAGSKPGASFLAGLGGRKRPFDSDALFSRPGASTNNTLDLAKRSKVSPSLDQQNAYALARLTNIEADTAKIVAETRLLELKYVLECRKNGLKAERLPDGRMAYVLVDVDSKGNESAGQTSPAATSELSDEQ